MAGAPKSNVQFDQFKELSRKLVAVPKREANEQKSRAKKQAHPKTVVD